MTPSPEAIKAALGFLPGNDPATPHEIGQVRGALKAAYAVDLPALRREAAAQALQEAVEAIREHFVGAHTYASENADMYRTQDEWARRIAQFLELRAASLRQDGQG